MRVMMVIDHPYGADAWQNTPHRRSFTVALAHAACLGLMDAGHEVDLVDLHADGFDPVMSADDLAAWRQGVASPDPLAADYQRRLLAAEHLVLAFPIWWEAMPAATKGFIDKVVTKGVVMRPGKGPHEITNATKLRGVTLITVMSTPALLYRLILGNVITKILFRGTFGKIGVRHLTWLRHAGAEHKTAAARQKMLDDVRKHFAALA
jgi:putative NADPH-quinone reductase